MHRAVIDPNVLVSAYISPRGSPARILTAILGGVVQPVASPRLLAELERVLLGSPSLAPFRDPDRIEELMAALGTLAAIQPDHRDPPSVCRDPSDDYLIALARSAGVPLISGDKDLTSADLADTPRAFCDRLGIR